MATVNSANAAQGNVYDAQDLSLYLSSFGAPSVAYQLHRLPLKCQRYIAVSNYRHFQRIINLIVKLGYI